jgi:hypothetical protein
VSLPISDSDEAAAWVDAAAYMAAHGERWADEAFAHLQTISLANDHVGFKRWIDLMDRMSVLALAARQ